MSGVYQQFIIMIRRPSQKMAPSGTWSVELIIIGGGPPLGLG